jgi:uridine kinase
MRRIELLQYLAAAILGIKKDSPILVGIDGVDASGKTTLADELATVLRTSNRPIIRASIDDFHNPEKMRYAKGKDSPEGYYRDSFNYKALQDVLLRPLRDGNPQYQSAVFDYRTDSTIAEPMQKVPKNAILIMDGIFLLRPELVRYWNYKIFLDVDFETSLKRAISRAAEKEHPGGEQANIRKYKERYIPGQQIYFEEAKPKKQADIVINNTDFSNPVIV